MIIVDDIVGYCDSRRHITGYNIVGNMPSVKKYSRRYRQPLFSISPAMRIFVVVQCALQKMDARLSEFAKVHCIKRDPKN